MPKRRKFINPFKGLSGGLSPAPINGEDNVSIQGKEPNVDSFSDTQSGNAIERQTVRKPNVGKDQGKTIKPNSGTVGRSTSRTVNMTQTQSGTIRGSSARTINTTQTQSGTVGRSSTHTKQTRLGTAGRSSTHTVSSSFYTRSGNDGEGVISHNVEAKLSDMFNLKEGVRVIVEWDKGINCDFVPFDGSDLNIAEKEGVGLDDIEDDDLGFDEIDRLIDENNSSKYNTSTESDDPFDEYDGASNDSEDDVLFVARENLKKAAQKKSDLRGLSRIMKEINIAESKKFFFKEKCGEDLIQDMDVDVVSDDSYDTKYQDEICRRRRS
ncbi:hypothetical protein ACFE04_021230 [Oxalis oulophora]